MKFRLLPCLAFLFVCSSAWAQSRLTGTVKDSSGAVVPGATINVKNNATASFATAVSDGDGLFAVPMLPPGDYTVTVTRQGFKTVTLQDVRLNAGVPATIKPVLSPGGFTEVVEVQGGVIPASAKEGGRADAFYVGAVYDALKKEVEKQKTIARYNKDAPFTGRINVVADKRIPYRTLMEVLYTAGQAELGDYKFTVLKAE